MTTPVAPINLLAARLVESAAEPTQLSAASSQHNFAQILLDGINRVDQKVQTADAAVTAFALDDSIAPHQVMFALAEARQSLQVMMQVRARLVEGYQEFMRMQL